MCNEYKFRAECAREVEDFRAMLPAGGALWPTAEPGVFRLHTNDFETAWAALAEVPDSHVMMESLAPAHSFTGERDYLRRTAPTF